MFFVLAKAKLYITLENVKATRHVLHAFENEESIWYVLFYFGEHFVPAHYAVCNTGLANGTVRGNVKVFYMEHSYFVAEPVKAFVKNVEAALVVAVVKVVQNVHGYADMSVV